MLPLEESLDAEIGFAGDFAGHAGRRFREFSKPIHVCPGGGKRECFHPGTGT